VISLPREDIKSKPVIGPIQDFVNWVAFVHKGEIALLVIDAQNDVLKQEGSLGAYGIWRYVEENGTIDSITSVVNVCHRTGVPVFWFRALRLADGNDIFPGTFDGSLISGKRRVLPTYFLGGTWDVEIIDEFKELMGEKDIVIDKPVYSAFEGTNLQRYLVQLGIKTLLLCGFLTDTCVEGTSRTAFDRGYMPVLIADACATSGEEDQRVALERHKRKLGPVVTSSIVTELLEAL
jgi:nicotinamidase-related amidase